MHSYPWGGRRSFLSSCSGRPRILRSCPLAAANCGPPSRASPRYDAPVGAHLPLGRPLEPFIVLLRTPEGSARLSTRCRQPRAAIACFASLRRPSRRTPNPWEGRRGSLGLRGPPWISLGLSGAPWASLGFPGPVWGSLGLPGPSWPSLGHSVASLSLPGPPRGGNLGASAALNPKR